MNILDSYKKNKKKHLKEVSGDFVKFTLGK